MGRYWEIGGSCSILTFANVVDPEYKKFGNNVQLSACTILGHDGSRSMLNRAYGKKLDKVGAVIIKDNVFVDHGAIILLGVTIGRNVIGAGTPAKIIGSTDGLVEKVEKETNDLPWAHIIKQREDYFDALLEPILKKARQKHFFNA